MYYISLFISIIIIIIIILQIYRPFLNSNPKDLLNNINEHFTLLYEYNHAKNDILDIEEESLINVNKLQGGIDDVNASNNNLKLDRPELVIKTSTLGKKIINETFEDITNKQFTLRLFYKNGCPYSSQFMPLWQEIKSSLPQYVNVEEFNCDRDDTLGTSICSRFNIHQIPTITLTMPDKVYPNEIITLTYRNKRNFHNIKLWLSNQGIELIYNPEVEHFDKYGNYMNIEQFNNLDNNSSNTGYSNKGIIGMVLSADGNLRKPYDDLYKAETRINQYGEYDDVDDDGCPIASFSICKENSPNPGYQIFTHRGQWGCVFPDPNTSINNQFDAAFAVADNYLHSLPPKMKQVVDDKGNINLEVQNYSATDKLNQMKTCALKYKKNFRNFGLCDNQKLTNKYNIKDMIDKGEANVPFNGMTSQDYQDTKETAEALYAACSL